ncbi:ABC transporter substrate-binding protein [Salmonella enterica]|nr:ABC transporter substrate-binding protein [Salmonella enterica]ECE0739825.1 ABC transporter substrate-binding protein [Salmonella enterica subsp. enterica serovar Hvittingfoss]HEC8061825.1 ABC transporter substrate-binding protein [Salmonella enterica subsp. enterica serovar Potsdam]EGA8118269.1 ABC transporter substrate-binding protein [Salmonella enterica]EHO8673548.1 ABC transporter substrate-binding protein [Salmonella enterica]
MKKTLFILLLACSGYLSVPEINASPHAIQVTDQNQREVVIAQPPQRIITFVIPLASTIMAIDGSPERLVGMNRASVSDVTEGLLGEIFPAAKNIAADIAGEGFAPNAEAVAVARPDVVFQWGDRGDAIVAPLRKLGLPVVTVNYGDTRLASHWFTLAGEVLGKPERGRQLAQWFDEEITAVEQLAATVTPDLRPRVVYLYRVRAGLQVAGKGTSMDSDIRRTGGNNMAQSLPGFTTVDVEQLLQWNPQVILLNNFEAGLIPADLLNDPRLTAIDAIKNKRVYSYPRGGFRWEPPSQESPLTQHWLLTLFHPHIAQGNFRARLKETYQFLYHYTLSEEQIDRILKLSVNNDSLNYCAQFCRKQGPQ